MPAIRLSSLVPSIWRWSGAFDGGSRRPLQIESLTTRIYNLLSKMQFNVPNKARNLRHKYGYRQFESRGRLQEVLFSTKITHNIDHTNLPEAKTAVDLLLRGIFTAPYAEVVLAGGLQSRKGVTDGSGD
eukprot:TRINITY_DN6196_c0_g1_i3.p2 TRINITY_DN6196_c0_g1~~TRINITY_DN6196_c0_g1_i3.p2  ORF type:complete len:129 (-),score=11.38 TRINITY_DN6196_c0_g1_i3:150-536(-)